MSLRDSAEVEEALRLLTEIESAQSARGRDPVGASADAREESDESGPARDTEPPDGAPDVGTAAPWRLPRPEEVVSEACDDPADAAPSEEPTNEASPAEEVEPSLDYRQDRLEASLRAMCRRGNFSGAVVADLQGLPLAVYNSPVQIDALAAFTSVLAAALERAAQLLEQQTAQSIISIDINYVDKVVLRRFQAENRPYSLMVLCGQELDARNDVELSIEEITTVLASR